MIRQGHSRFVITIPFLRIVIKIAKVKILIFLKNLWKFRNDFRRIKLLCNLKIHPQTIGGKELLFNGIYTNYKEFQFYILNENKTFLQPTYFSLFGLFNIQKYGERVDIGQAEYWSRLVDVTGSEIVKDGHHFENSKNLCFDRQIIKIFDYGHYNTRDLLSKYQSEIFSVFNKAEWVHSLSFFIMNLN